MPLEAWRTPRQRRLDGARDSPDPVAPVPEVGPVSVCPWLETLVRELQVCALLDDPMAASLPVITGCLPETLIASEELVTRSLLAQAALRCAMRQVRPASVTTSMRVLDLLKVSADRGCVKAEIAGAWSALAAAIAGNAPGRRGATAGRHQDPRIGMAIQFVERHCADPDFNARAVPPGVGLSPSAFARLFRRETGGPVSALILTVRMRRAEELLGDPALSVKEIAAATGYTHPPNFTRAFVRHRGLSPTAFRKDALGWATRRRSGSAVAGHGRDPESPP